MLNMVVSVDCRCWPVHTKVSGRGSTDRVFLPTEKASVICAETRAGGKRGKLLNWLFPPPKFLYQLGLIVLQSMNYFILPVCLSFHVHYVFSLQDVSELRNELQRKELLVQKHLSKLHHWQQVLEDVSVQHRKPSDLPPPGPLAFLEQASASLPPAPLKPNWHTQRCEKPHSMYLHCQHERRPVNSLLTRETFDTHCLVSAIFCIFD